MTWLDLTYAAEAVTVDQFPVDFVLMPQLWTSAALFLELNSHLVWRMKDDIGLCYLYVFPLHYFTQTSQKNTAQYSITLMLVVALHQVRARKDTDPDTL